MVRDIREIFTPDEIHAHAMVCRALAEQKTDPDDKLALFQAAWELDALAKMPLPVAVARRTM